MKLKSIAVIGLGRFGSHLAVTLSESGHQVLALDRDEAKVNKIAELVTDAVCIDVTDEDALRSAGIKSYDIAVISLSENMEDSILLTLFLKELGIPKTVVRAISERHKTVLERLGADKVIFPEQDMGEKLAYMIDRTDVMEYIEFSPDYSIIELRVPAPWAGKTLRELDLRKKHGVNAIAVIIGQNKKIEINIDPDRAFAPDDVVALVGNNAALDKLR